MEPSHTISCRHCRREIGVREDSPGREIACPHCGQITPIVSLVHSNDAISGREVYNVVSDTVTGVNLRRRDNLWQLAAIGIGLLLGIVIGVSVAQDGGTGAIVGGFAGVLVGLFGSGIFLMIYRIIRHLLGDHK